jgi:hypothetical protein
MIETSRFLDPNSEMIALATFDNTKNIFLIAMEIKGPFDENLFKPSVIATLEGFPELRCCLWETRKNGRHYLYWHPRPDVEFLTSISDLKDLDASTPILDAVLKHLAPRLDRDWDLFNETPGEAHLLRASKDHYVVVALVHHAVFDAATVAELGRRFFLQYRELVTGVKDDLPGLTNQSVSTSRKRTVKVRRRKWEDIVYSGRLAIEPLISRPPLPAGTGAPTDRKQHHIKRVLSEEETVRLTMSTQKSGGAFMDILVAYSNLAIERWNSHRSIETGKITTSVTMNIRGRYAGLDHLNNVSALFFESRPDDREDPKKLVHSISIHRIRQFRKQMDLRLYENVSRMIACANVFPFRVRRRIVHNITQKHQWSIAIILLGILWPEMKNGKPTLDSYPTCVNQTQVCEVFGTGYKTMTSTPLLLIVYSFMKKINIILTASGSLFTREEAEAFMDLFMRELREGI